MLDQVIAWGGALKTLRESEHRVGAESTDERTSENIALTAGSRRKSHPHTLTNKRQEVTMKGISKTTHAGLDPLIPAVLAPLEVLAQAPQGFISAAAQPQTTTSPGVPQYLDSTSHSGGFL